MTEVDRLLELNGLVEMTPRIVEEAEGQLFLRERRKSIEKQAASKAGPGSEGEATGGCPGGVQA